MGFIQGGISRKMMGGRFVDDIYRSLVGGRFGHLPTTWVTICFSIEDGDFK